jgi:hypothetical protein
MSKYTVIIDTSEQKPWVFKKSEFCAGSRKQSLDTGDYTLEGYEDKFIIEKKGAVTEYYNNICTSDIKRFRKELDRMGDFEHAFVILEFSLSDMVNYPWSTNLPYSIKMKIGNKGDYFLRQFIQLQIEYPNVNFILCGKEAQKVVNSIFKRIIEYYED